MVDRVRGQSQLRSPSVFAGNEDLSEFFAPSAPVEPGTIKDCGFWYNNIEGLTCDRVLEDSWVSKEEFLSWNPSLNSNCEPWNERSYCYLSQERFDEYYNLVEAAPSVWEDYGCVTPLDGNILQENITGVLVRDGRNLADVPFCQESCEVRKFTYAGLQEGNECWCGDENNGLFDESNDANCNVPCIGDEKTFCGGKGLMHVYHLGKDEAYTELSPWDGVSHTADQPAGDNSTTRDGTGNETSQDSKSEAENPVSEGAHLHAGGMAMAMVTVLLAALLA
ncbi:hypothetical protein M011DRAFT_489701 [Sporormia fimetaria CBS 119925]|uniref:WSC domain-containing protein n=1 Tax=Sporormia fimetaria CBS 119925 TaxID=1340428 RepID=A0A6A6V1A2_9PLEO|nr:hypothetical protein M011DRAFT_489701 [Sporormia fimetaria CBS 119925]